MGGASQGIFGLARSTEDDERCLALQSPDDRDRFPTRGCRPAGVPDRKDSRCAYRGVSDLTQGPLHITRALQQLDPIVLRRVKAPLCADVIESRRQVNRGSW